MTFKQAVVVDCLGGKLPLKWRRRVGKWQSWGRAQMRKLDQWNSGNSQRWINIGSRKWKDIQKL